MKSRVFLDQLIADQHRAIRYYVWFSIGLALLGLIVIIVAVVPDVSPLKGAMNSMLGVGGGFVSSLGAFPLKEVLNRREKLGILTTMKTGLSGSASDETGGVSPEKADELLWQIIQKTALG